MRRIGNGKCRQGFTLLETLVALALLGTVMASMAVSIDLYWKYRTQSHQRLSASRILLGIVEDLTLDLRSAVVPSGPGFTREVPESPNAAKSGSDRVFRSGAGREQALQVREQQLDLQPDEALPIHFTGTRDSFAVLTRSQNPRFVSPGDFQPGPEQHVIWRSNPARSLRIPLSHVGPRQIDVAIGDDTQKRGVIRTVRSFQRSSHQTGRDETLETIVSEDVGSMTFRYSDGRTWADEWNSTQRFDIPTAVEVSLWIRTEPDRPFVSVIRIPQGGHDP